MKSSPSSSARVFVARAPWNCGLVLNFANFSPQIFSTWFAWICTGVFCIRRWCWRNVSITPPIGNWIFRINRCRTNFGDGRTRIPCESSAKYLRGKICKIWNEWGWGKRTPARTVDEVKILCTKCTKLETKCKIKCVNYWLGYENCKSVYTQIYRSGTQQSLSSTKNIWNFKIWSSWYSGIILKILKKTIRINAYNLLTEGEKSPCILYNISYFTIILLTGYVIIWKVRARHNGLR